MTTIQKLMLSMFLHLRLGVGIIGLSLPLVLVFGGKAMGVSFAGSMSAYYHATPQCSLPQCPDAMRDAACQESGKGPMRNWFVGNLFFVGAAMFLMKGFSNWENWALNLAGLAAPCVALFPMEWPCRTAGFSIHSFHFPSAITFFLCAGFTLHLLLRENASTDSQPEPNGQEENRDFSTMVSAARNCDGCVAGAGMDLRLQLRTSGVLAGDGRRICIRGVLAGEDHRAAMEPS